MRVKGLEVLELELPEEDLPKDGLEMIEECPQADLCQRGVYICKKCLNRKIKRRNGFKYLQKLRVIVGRVNCSSEKLTDFTF